MSGGLAYNGAVYISAIYVYGGKVSNCGLSNADIDIIHRAAVDIYVIDIDKPRTIGFDRYIGISCAANRYLTGRYVLFVGLNRYRLEVAGRRYKHRICVACGLVSDL